MTEGSQPAYPEIHVYHWRGHDKDVGETDNVLPRWRGGLTKREYFAAAVLSGMRIDDATPENAAQWAVKYADALIEELNK